MKLDKKYLKDLDFWKERCKLNNFKPLNMNKKYILNLIKDYKIHSMAEYSFCWKGMEESCWTELIEEGNWGATKEDVEKSIKDNIKYVKKYLYNRSKYGDRMFISQDENSVNIYIFMRDIIAQDYFISFKN